jgi:Putative Flp pilus-assembly TadE/G-like
MRLLKSLLRRGRGERGQALPLVVLSAVVLVGFTGMAVDLARVWITQQELQRAVDAATLAAGQDLPDTSTAYTAALKYSGTGTGGNAVNGWGVTPQTPSVTFECLSHGPSGSYTAGNPPTCLTDSSGDGCHPSSGGSSSNTPAPSGVTTCNAVNITESAKVSTGLLSLFIPSFTVSASSTAASRGSLGLPQPMNVFVILDTTGSMEDSCSATVPITSTKNISNPDKLDCAKAGVRSFLEAMPMTDGTVDDDVGIMVFPGLTQTLNPTPTTTTTLTRAGTITGSATKNSTTMSVTASASAYVGDVITGTGMASSAPYTTITGANTINSGTRRSPVYTYTVTLSSAATSNSSNATYTIDTTSTTTTYGAPYTLSATPSTTALGYETDCSSSHQPSVTYPPYVTYTNSSASTTTGGISPSTDLYDFTNSPSYTSPGYVDNYPGYEAVPLSSNYLSSAGVLNTSTGASASALVESVYWAQCSNATYPGGDYYGIKEVGGQGSYLAGAITAAQYALWQQPQTRTIDGQSESVTNAIVILSDGELNDPDSSRDGVDPGASGNVSFSSSTPCQDAFLAAQAAKADGTLIFSIAYDDSGADCKDSGRTTSSGTSYDGTLPYSGSASTLMEDMSSGTAYYADQSSAGDLTADFTQAGNELTGSSALIPDCTQAPPAC